MATKCNQINDSISDPTGGTSLTGIVAVVTAAQGASTGGGMGDLTFNLKLQYFSSVANLDSGKEPLLWSNLQRQCQVTITEAEWDSNAIAPNDLIHDKLNAWLLDPAGGGYSNVVEIVK